MDLKNTIKLARRSFVRYGLFIFTWIFRYAPYWFSRCFVGAMFAVINLFLGKLRRHARESLHIAFGTEKSEAEINDIIKHCFKNFGANLIEMLYYVADYRREIKNVRIEGKENLERVLKQGKGAVCITAHFGNFPLMFLYMAKQGYPSNVIARKMRDQVVEKFINDREEAAGLFTFRTEPKIQCVRDTINALRKNELVFIPIDQHFGGEGGVYVDFFGKKAATPTGPVVFHKRTGAPLLPFFIVRQPDNSHVIHIEPPMGLEPGENEEEVITATVQKMTHLVEAYARQYPYEWSWMHRRWKHLSKF